MKLFFTIGLIAVLFFGSCAQARQWHAAAIPAPTPTATPIDFAVDRIFQRVGVAKIITFRGTYENASDSSIDIQIIDATSLAVIIPWTTLQNSPTGGFFSGTLSVPQYNGWMKWMVRVHSNQNTLTTSTNKFGVGALILLSGQSNMAGLWAKNSGTPPTPTDNARRYAGNGWLAIDATAITGEVTDGFNSGRGGDGICELANKLHTLLGVNIGLLEYAVGGTTSAQWAPGGSMYIQTVGPSLAAPFGIAYQDVGSDTEVIFHYQGETDVQNGTGVVAWTSNMLAFFNGVKGLTRNSLVMGIQPLGWAISYPGITDTPWSAIKGGQLALVQSNPSIMFLTSLQDDGTLFTAPLIHYNPASYQRFARRIAQSYGQWLGINSVSAAGPVISSVTWAAGSPTLLTVNITPTAGASLQDGVGGTGTSVNGFRVFNGASQLTVNSKVISGNTVVLTMAASISSGNVTAGNIQVDYEFGASPHGASTPPNLANFVYDTANPTGDTIGLPLQFTNGKIVVTQ